MKPTREEAIQMARDVGATETVSEYGNTTFVFHIDSLHTLVAATYERGVADEGEEMATGKQRLHVSTGWAAPKDQYAVPVMFNPYTGEPRDVRDVQSDPQGILIVPPGKVNQLAAMQGGQK